MLCKLCIQPLTLAKLILRMHGHRDGGIKGMGAVWEAGDRKRGKMVKDAEEGVEIRKC